MVEILLQKPVTGSAVLTAFDTVQAEINQSMLATGDGYGWIYTPTSGIAHYDADGKPVRKHRRDWQYAETVKRKKFIWWGPVVSEDIRSAGIFRIWLKDVVEHQMYDKVKLGIEFFTTTDEIGTPYFSDDVNHPRFANSLYERSLEQLICHFTMSV